MSRLIHHRHTGRLAPHARTSYPALAFILMLVGVLLSTGDMTALAATPAVNPQSGSLGLQGVVRGPAPTVAAVILTPRNGSIINSSPITVSGSCPVNTYVSLYKNDIFGGVVPCAGDGTFSMLADLLIGSNRLVARVFDALSQNGPDSAAVTVLYQPTSINISNSAPGHQLFLHTEDAVLGITPGQSLTRSITVVGGDAPYAVSWDFGDGSIQAVPQGAEGDSKVSHTYVRAGTYKVIVRVTDSSGNSALIQLVTVVNGPVAVGTGNKNTNLPGILIGAWPLYMLAVLMVFVFWIGEQREVYVLRKQNRLNSAI